MGILNFELEPYHMKAIKGVLDRRGLKPDLEDEWEIHGPHSPDLPFAVYVGYAYKEAKEGAKCICPSKKIRLVDCPAHRRYYCLAIYPKAVYEIEDPSQWGEDAIPENRIYTK